MPSKTARPRARRRLDAPRRRSVHVAEIGDTPAISAVSSANGCMPGRRAGPDEARQVLIGDRVAELAAAQRHAADLVTLRTVADDALRRVDLKAVGDVRRRRRGSRVGSGVCAAACRALAANDRITTPSSFRMAALLTWELLERRLGVARHANPGRVHHHRQIGVVALDPRHLHHPRFPELRQRPRLGRVTDALVRLQLGAEVVEDLLVFRQAERPAAFGDGGDHVLLQSTLERGGGVRVELEVVGPLPGGNQDRNSVSFGLSALEFR